MHQENFVEKSSAALDFLPGVIAFLSGLIVTMTWLHFSVPFGLNVNVSSFLLMLSFMPNRDHDLVALFGTLWFECECLLFPADVELYDPSCNINRGSGGTQE
jgi:hypothetical protein